MAGARPPASNLHALPGQEALMLRDARNDVTFEDLVIALHEAADSPREALAVLDHLLRTQRVSFRRPADAARRLGLGGGPGTPS